MIFATDPTIYDGLRNNIVWYHQHDDLLRLEQQTDDLALAVMMTYSDLDPRKASKPQVEAFNRACEAYRAGR